VGLFSELHQIKKEAGMKKTVIVLLALFLALPAVSFAGSATSRWDMTIGGYVKFDMGWGSQQQGVDAVVAQRKGNGPYTTADDNYGNFYSYGGETRLNFDIKGPDAWGAKTSAFVEGHFRGDSVSSPAFANDTFSLRHAFMAFDWPTTKLTIGHTWQKWGLLPTFANTLLEYNGLAPFLKGSRQPQVKIETIFAKNWTAAFAVMSSTNTLQGNSSSGKVDSFTTSGYPFFEGSFGWTTDKCGKIGPWQMLFAVDGFYGRETRYQAAFFDKTGNTIGYSDQTNDSWGVAFKGFIPIIPEKKGNKANALSLSGVVFYAQNPGWYQGSPAGTSTQTYNFGTLQSPDFHAPVTYGGWGQISYFITDKFFVNGWYGYLRNEMSQFAATTAAGGAIQNTTQYIVNVMYDVNAAVRFGIEGAYFNTRYASLGTTATPGTVSVPVTQKDGEYYTVRVGAYYFF
jgi:hypothetical protein